MKFVESKDLRPGMRLAKPIYNKMGVMLYDRNSYLTMSGIKSIENFGLIGLFILEPAEPLPPVSQEDLEFEQFQIVYMFRIKDIMDRLQKEQEPEGLPELTLEILKQFGSLSRKRSRKSASSRWSWKGSARRNPPSPPTCRSGIWKWRKCFSSNS